MDVTVTVTVPEGALSALRQGPLEFAEELKRAAVAKWYELGVVSQSKGSRSPLRRRIFNPSMNVRLTCFSSIDMRRSNRSRHTSWFSRVYFS